MQQKKKVVTFGEIMMRLCPPRFQRFNQATSFEVTYGGAEAAVAVSLANFGIPVDYVTRLPKNDLGDACLNFIRQFAVGTEQIIRGGERLGIFFNEIGAVQRGDKVIYDRVNSSLATIKPGMFDWKTIFSDVGCFHWTGITPAISQGAAEVCLEAVKKAKEVGVTVTCDLNYRSKLWKWGKTAREVMSGLVRHVDVVIGNEEDVDKIFGIKALEVDITTGKVDADKYLFVAKRLMEEFSNLQKVAFTLRGSISASHNTWSGVLYDGDTFYKAPVYQITDIVDRTGGGDAFVGGLIYGLFTYGNDLQRALNFAVAASCLKHTIPSVFNITTIEEVDRLMKGVVSGRIKR